jgi:hypothetical protein
MCVTPKVGTSPCVGFSPTSPQAAAGMRTLPPWSTPSASSTSPAATAALEPEEEPPAERLGSIGFRAAPKTLVSPKPDAEKSSRLSFPAIVPPAARMRSTTTASCTGVYESVRDPFVSGTPATAMLSLMPTRRPASGPSSAPRMSVMRTNAFTGSSSGVGRRPGVRGEVTGTCTSGRSSTSSKARTKSAAKGTSSSHSAAESGRPSRRAARARSSASGGRRCPLVRGCPFTGRPRTRSPPRPA